MTSAYKVFRLRVQILRNYFYDMKRFIRFSATTKSTKARKSTLEASLLKNYHRIEKALALPEPRFPFGEKLVNELTRDLKAHINLFEYSPVRSETWSALTGHVKAHQKKGIYNKNLESTLKDIEEACIPDEKRINQPTLLIKRDEIESKSKIDLKHFFNSRHSIRQFTDEKVDAEVIKQAVVLAQKTPSVCNRQCAKVYVFEDEAVAKVLKHQNGNRGFGHQLKTVLLVTADTSAFLNLGERNQCWIDGGLFSMSLIYALHSFGVGTCCLNWSVEWYPDKNLREAAKIPESEAIVMFIAVGRMPEELKVATSPRKPLSSVLEFKNI